MFGQAVEAKTFERKLMEFAAARLELVIIVFELAVGRYFLEILKNGPFA